jgi:TAG lipase/lysophosphatidylethanolamine acyltransferase
VVLALHKQGLLPRIVTGTATGALIAALVCVHTEAELPDILTPEGIDLTAFSKRGSRVSATDEEKSYNFEYQSWYTTSRRRLKRLWQEGHLLDMTVLSECVRANVEDLTFEEAYLKTKRVLNITVPSTDGGIPVLLNYLTAPSVVSISRAKNNPEN